MIIKHGKIRINNPSHSRPFLIFLVAFTAVSLASLFLIPFDWMKILVRMKNMGEVLQRLFSLSLMDIDVTLLAFVESVCVAILATVYSAVLGLLFGVIMARNISPARVLSPIFSAAFAFIRAVPAFIWVLLVLVCLGFGPAPAIVGVCIHSTAFFARAFSHAFEEVDEGTLEALVSTGASRVKVFFSAILPASLTSVIAWITLNFETNFRATSILGMVGAGGVGYIISASMSSYKYDRGMTAILLVLAFSYTVEIAFNALKQKL